MKQLLFISFLIIAVMLKSQTINIPAPVAKTIVKELINCDSAKAMLSLTKEQLDLTEQKVTYKDSVIYSLKGKETLYEERIKNEQQKYEIQGNFVKDLQKQNKQLKVKSIIENTIFGSVSLGLTIGLIYTIIK